MPKGAKLLAYNDNDSTQSFSYENHIWGTQFHPEFLAEITKEYIKFDKENIINSGKNYEKIYKEVEEQNYGEVLLKKFMEIVNESWKFKITLIKDLIILKIQWLYAIIRLNKSNR